MIPKRIIYGNFGNMTLRPEVELMCIESWKQVFPESEWEWFELNEKTFDVNSHRFTKEAYEKKLYSFVNDYARTWALYTMGGIYLDMDQLMLKPLDDLLLQEKMFIGSCMHKEIEDSTKDITSWGIVGAEKGNEFIAELLKSFDVPENYIMKKNKLLVMTETRRLLLQFEKINKKEILENDIPISYEHLTVYPFDYFTGMFWTSDKTFITDRTYGIQLYGSSWQTKALKSKAADRLKRFFNEVNYEN